MDIATSRLNRPKGRFSENSYNTIYYNLNMLGVYLYLAIFNRLGVAGAVLQTALCTELVSYSYYP